MNKAIFFDRDGIINKRLVDEYVCKIEDFELMDEIIGILKYVKMKGYLAIVITNQQGIGKGLMSEDDLIILHDYMQNILQERAGERFDAIFYCPELAESNHPRRKPNPGMILEAMELFDIDPKQSLMIGDSISDAQAAINAGIKGILIGDFEFEHSDVIVLPDLKNLLVNINHSIT
ncbi:MAG: HAD family hydrolase [Ignavibacteriae bacterium HGW-Ignavibacteriae-1]|nr:MAG: HAD family hydrolase [Ignavibacteriae bacterium HGW-Ignavibacteriae-1]